VCLPYQVEDLHPGRPPLRSSTDLSRRTGCLANLSWLIHGARSAVSQAAKSTDSLALWAMKLRVTKPFNKVAVAVTHLLACLIWILLTRQEHYRAMPRSLEVSV
jgi:hypothetical protein